MIKNIEIDGKQMTVIILGEKGWVDIQGYRKAFFNVLECATLFKDFDMCVPGEQVWTLLQFIKALGVPKEKEGGESC